MRLVIACPSYKREHPMHAASREATLRRLGDQACYFRRRGDSALLRARASLLGLAYREEPNFTHLLQVDDDQSWDVRHLERLVELDYPLAGLPCAFRSDDEPLRGRATVRRLPGPIDLAADGTFPVKFLGGGFILWRRDLLDAMRDAYPETEFDTNDAGAEQRFVAWDFWSGGVAERELLTEDYWACHLATELGVRPRVWWGACSPHWGGDPDDPSTWRGYVPDGFEPVDANARRKAA